MIGQTISHYKVLEKLGEGGMGVVYKAEDQKLKRNVALKFLPPSVAGSDEELARFQQEAEAISALNHPSVATIFDVDEADDQKFLVLEYIAGGTLKGKLRANKESGASLPITTVLEYGIQIAEGLGHADRHEIVHRDVKSDNIMLTEDGKIKITDFGLAKLREAGQITRVGSTVGTAGYMSPEQMQGQEIDARSDLFSLGIVLYELASGEMPFRGEHEAALAYSIVNEDAASLTSSRPDVPARLEEIVSRCLAKDPSDRYQTADDVAASLTELRNELSGRVTTVVKQSRTPWLAAGAVVVGFIAAFILFDIGTDRETASTGEVARLAVLPFVGMRDDPETNFLGIALADQIISSLSYVQTVLVRPTSSIRSFEGRAVDPATVGDELKVDYVVTGTHLKEDDRIRLKVELVNTGTNELVWSENINTEYASAFTLQDIVSERVVARLKNQFGAGERAGVSTDVASDPVAYEYYLRSISYSMDIEGSDLAIEMLTKAIAIDSTFAPLYAELGWRHQLQASYAGGGVEQVRLSEESFKTALGLNPDFLPALTGLGTIYTEAGRTGEAAELIQKALAINPNSADARFWMGYLYRYGGMLDEAVVQMEMAVGLDPGNRRFRSIGHTYWYVGEYEKSFEAYLLDAGTAWTNSALGGLHNYLGNRDSARHYLELVIASEPEGAITEFCLAELHHMNGDFESALQEARKLEARNPPDGEMNFFVAHMFGMLGDRDGVVRSLRRGVDGGFFSYPLFLSDRWFDFVRDDPEFQEILQMAKEKHEVFKAKYQETL